MATHSEAVLEVREETFNEILKKLADAGYDFLFHMEGKRITEISMSGLRLKKKKYLLHSHKPSGR